MKKIIYALSLFLYWFIPHIVWAQNADDSLASSIKQNYLDVAGYAKLREGNADQISPIDLFGFYFSLAMSFTGILFVVQILHGGFLWMTASGNDDQVDKARKKLSNGTIGAAIVFSAYIVVVFILTQLSRFTGLDSGGFGA